MSLHSSIPTTPRVISPSPTHSENGETNYFGPITRSAKRKAIEPQTPIDEGTDEESGSSGESAELRRARSKSRSPIRLRGAEFDLTARRTSTPKFKAQPVLNGNGKAVNRHLSPNNGANSPGWNWRDFSRSPSPLGLIPIHRSWRVFVHRHEIPRKALHVSIGFFTTYIYFTGAQPSSITPYLMAAFIPIATTDYLRHTYPALNRFYVRVLGAFMREIEYEGWNGVIWYLLGAWIVLSCFPKDVGVMGVLLLSWCDTAASTIGRAYGRYTPRLRKGKSLAGSLAAFAVGVVTAGGFWGYLMPQYGAAVEDHAWPSMFTGCLGLPKVLSNAVGLSEAQSSITGAAAVGVLSLWTGLVASASEVVDIFGWDDNLTIPVLSGLGIWGFLKVFGR